MQVDLNTDGETAVLVVSGELDMSCSGDLTRAALGAIDEPRSARLRLDLSGLDFIDSSGINALIEIRNAARSAQVALELSRPSARVAEVLRLTAVDDLFDIRDA